MYTQQCINALSRASPISTQLQVGVWYSSKSVSMPYLELLPFLRYPLKNPVKYSISRPVFRRYLFEYSEKSPFLGKNWHVYNLFIIISAFILL